MTNLGPLSTTFTPSSTCSSYTGMSWILEPTTTGEGYFLRGPSKTNSAHCFPSSYLPNYTEYYYSPGLCPSGYQPACTSYNSAGTNTETVFTCCPTGVNWQCMNADDVEWPWQSTLACTGTSVFSIVTVVSDVTSTSVSTREDCLSSSCAGGAYGIVVRFQSTDFASTTIASSTEISTSSTEPATTTVTASSSPSSTSSPSSGISGGAIAGIVIGVVGGLAIAAVAGWFLWRKRRTRGAYQAANPVAEVDGQSKQHHELDPSPAPVEMASTPVYELPGQ